MNNLKYLNKTLIGLLFAGLITSTYSCSDKMDEITSIDYGRNFSVLEIRIDRSQQTMVKLDWPKIKNSTAATTYTIELAKDPLFANGAEHTFQSETNSLTITDSEIAVRTDFYARIKANAEEGKEESKWFVSNKFRITGVQYLKPLKYEDITSTSVTLSWQVPNQVSHLTLNGVNYAISDVEKASGVKEITGLTEATTYEVIIYDGTADKGTLTFATKTGIPSGNIINVSANPADPSQSLQNLLLAAQHGDIFVLEQGGKYSLTTVTLPNGSITIFGEEGPNKPILNVEGQINLPTTGGIIKFQNIYFSGYANGIAQGTKRNYIINQSSATTVEELIFENCEIRNLTNSPIRLQNAANAKTIQKLTIEQCVVEDIGNNGTNGTYCFINNNAATNKINNISITNSTFSGLGYALILHNQEPSQSVTIDNCTFYNVIGNGRNFIDYNAASYGDLKISNSIIAKSLSPAASAGGIRGNGTLIITNSYKTSDLVTSASTPFTGISSYASDSESLFLNPTGFNFTIEDLNFAGRLTAGDPRWR